MPHKGERVNLHLTDSGESAVIITATRGSGGEMAKTKSMSKPTEKYMETKWNKKLALHEGNMELDIPTVNISFDEKSVTVVSNYKIIFETKTDINLGKTEFGANAQGSGVEETKKITLAAEELVTLQVTNKNSVIELDENNTIHSFLDDVLMEGSNKVPMPTLVSQGQEAGKAAEEAKKAEEERKAAAEAARKAAEEKEKGGWDWGKIAFGVGLVALGAVAIVVSCGTATPLVAAGIMATGLSAAAATSVATAVTVGVAVAGAVTAATGVADVVEGIREDSFNPIRDTVFKGHEDWYYNAQFGAMMLSIVGTEFLGPYHAASQTQRSMNQQAAKGGATNAAASASKGTGKLTGSFYKPSQAERTMVDDLLSQGKNVEIVPRSNVQGVKTPDFKVNGVLTELKSLEGTSLNTPVTRIQKGFGQGAQTVIIDGRATGLTAEQANTVINRINGIYKNGVPGKIEIWTNEGTVFGGK
jgi:hypothetical protein